MSGYHFAGIATPKIKNVQLVDRFGSEPSIVGTVHLTTSHFVFRADNGGKEIWVGYSLIASVERCNTSSTSSSTGGSCLLIKCKHFLVLTILLPRDTDCQSLLDALLKCSRLANISDCFAFSHRSANPAGSDRKVGASKGGSAAAVAEWYRLDWSKEFERQGVTASESNADWRESDFNANYAYCDTYPERLWLPSKASTQLLIGSSKFRSKGRLPALTYYYRPNGATLCRCAQPLAGFSARCVEDEALMELIMHTNPSTTPLYVIDTRPRVNAMVNKVQGKGFEDERNYTNMQFHSFDIENIHVMRNSLNKLLEACSGGKPQLSISDYLKVVDNSGWLKHLRSLLECGKFIAESILRGNSCVVHCSDGWDRTAQTVSLAQLILDPHYRSINGFQCRLVQVLLEKDWLGFGFKFDDRCGHLSSANGATSGNTSSDETREISPVFTQFLDVVHQMAVRKPTAFEFNERFLLELNEHAYSCLYGTFLGNSNKERRNLRLTQRTQSLWNYMDRRRGDFTNPFYKETPGYLMDIDLRASSFSVWTHMYNRFDTGIQQREYLEDVALTTQCHIRQMENWLGADANSSLSHCVDNGTNRQLSSPLPVSVKWQSLLLSDECSSSNCRVEFLSRFDRRFHCSICGKIYCHRCLRQNNAEGEVRMCKGCANSSNVLAMNSSAMSSA